MNDPFSLQSAQRLDAADELAGFASAFHHPTRPDGTRYTYLCGHSLGLQPRSVGAYVQQELDDWARGGVRGHEEAHRPWIPYHHLAAATLAELVGAHADEVVAMNSLTVNLHLMMTSFFRPTGLRNKVLMEASSFGSDRYAVSSQLHLHGLNEADHLIELAPRQSERCLRTEDILERIEREGSRLSLVLLPGVQYLTGQSFELQPIIAAARRVGAAVGIDLAHGVGNMQLHLHDWGADFAVWCSYKYLNAGPGATGGCFVHARHARSFELPRLAGWWGHDEATRFEMGPQFRPIAGADGWQLSNPPILATAPLLASLEVFKSAGIANLRRKSVALTGYLEKMIQTRLGHAIDIITPAQVEQRGCQLSLRVIGSPADARRCFTRLSAAGVLADWREPDIIRVAPIPLYNSFADCFNAVQALTDALAA